MAIAHPSYEGAAIDSSPSLAEPSGASPHAHRLSADWEAFLGRYQDGTSALNAEELPLLQPADLLFEGDSPADTPCGHEMAAPLEAGKLEYAKEMYRRSGFLPAVNSSREEQRRQTVHRYSLSQPKKIQAIHDLTDLAREIFDVPTAIINVVLEDKVVFVSTSGWSTKEKDPDAPLDSIHAIHSMCPHAMAKAADADCFIIPDTSKEWRFARSPLVQEGKGPVGFFASSNINLPAHVPSGSPPAALPVGSFCLLDKKPRPALTPRQQNLLKKMAQMAAKEFELAFQKERNALIERRNTFVGGLFRSLLVYPSRILSTSFEERCSLDGIAQNLNAHTGSDFAFILDLRYFNFDSTPDSPPLSPVEDLRTPFNSASPKRPPFPRQATRTSQTSRRSFSFRREPSVHGPGSIRVMDCWCSTVEGEEVDLDQKRAEWVTRLNTGAGFESVSKALRQYHANERTSWAAPDAKNTPLATILPHGTTAYIASPIFDHDGEPALYVIVGSRERHFVYEDSDERFVSAIGGILMAAMLQEKIVVADQAKMAFVGQVSHELRTPIFAIAGNIDLVRQLTCAQALEKIAPLLDVAETCLGTLKDVLDDCLEYSKLSNSSNQRLGASPDVVPPLKLTRCTIMKLVTDVIKSCWSKEKRYAEMMDRKDGGGVAIVLESHFAPNVEALCDVGGLKRIGINLLGNALKFTSSGAITIRLSDVTPSASSTTTTRHIRFDVIDSGKGMTQEFLRDSLFTPFKQADPFAAGAGLGVSLAAQLVARMGGKISFSSDVGVGTTATVVVPVEIVSSAASSSAPPVPLPIIHNFSDEFISLASGHGTPSSSRAPSPTRRASLFSPPTSVAPSAASPLTTSLPTSGEDPQRKEDLTLGAVEARSASSAEGEKNRQRAVPALDAPLQASAEGGAVRVMVVDDNPLARRILCAFLKSKNVTYTEAGGGAEAIKLFESFRPNLVWCDIQMPDVDGIAATRQMRRVEEQEGRQRARIVAISGLDANHGEHGELIESGQVDRWIVKGGSSLRTLTSDMLKYADRLTPAHPPSSASLPPPPSSSVLPPAVPTVSNGAMSHLQAGIEQLQVQI
ncbi:hypothetical protein JCM6882_006547 [Rhodosporidiobolus microsporus]